MQRRAQSQLIDQADQRPIAGQQAMIEALQRSAVIDALGWIGDRSDLPWRSRQEPRLNRYSNSSQSVATPAVDHQWNGDVYLSLKSISPQSVTLGVWWFPHISFVWIGGLLIGFAVLWSRLARKPARDADRVPQAASDAG